MTRNKPRNPVSSSVFAERLKEVQARTGLGNEAAAREIGVGLRLYQLWRSGRLPSMGNVIRLARFYGVTIGWLLGEETEAAA